MEALRSIEDDDSFKIKSPEATEAKDMAKKLLEWCLVPDNNVTFTTFVVELAEDLRQAMRPCRKTSCNREKLWRNFFLLRSSDDFRKKWIKFLECAKVVATPHLYQHVTDVIFRRYITEHVTESASASATKLDPAPALTQREGNALRYAAGYVCRHIRNKIERSNHKFKEEIVLCLMALTKDSPEDGTEHTYSEEWILLIDRGGLWHIKETTFSLFIAIEEEVRECLKMLLGHPDTNPSAGKREEIITKVIAGDDVQFYWLITTADFEIEEAAVHAALLEEIVRLYVTMRGFSYSSFWVEKYKQSTKKAHSGQKAYAETCMIAA